jgi:cytochrome o ubiquinol oxidase subunit 2
MLRGLSLAAPALLTGCQGGILDPKGQVGADEKSLIITATLLMLLVVVPVIVMTLAFAWKYRASNTAAVYEPKWSHSTKIEAVVWIIPIIIIVILGSITWTTTHKLDPYRPLDSAVKPVTIEAVSLDWKWLFIYPEQGIATVNEIAFPANTPVNFKITSDSVMNSFFIPQLGGQIYSMTGMQTKLSLIANEAGSYDGMSAQYSGGGFSGMKFKAIATKSPAEFDAWVAKVRATAKPLDAVAYRAVAKPSENTPVAYYGSVTPNLFEAVLAKYMSKRTSLAATDADLKIAALAKALCAPSVVKE